MNVVPHSTIKYAPQYHAHSTTCTYNYTYNIMSPFPDAKRKCQWIYIFLLSMHSGGCFKQCLHKYTEFVYKLNGIMLFTTYSAAS